MTKSEELTQVLDPNWKENVMKRLTGKKKNRAVVSRRTLVTPDMSRVTFKEGLFDLLSRCAEARGISRMSYMRRAISAFIAHDMGVPLTQILEYSLPPVPFGKRGSGVQVDAPECDDGTGYGAWSIVELEEVQKEEHGSDG